MLLSSSTAFPSFILWAFVTIPLSPACLKILLSVTTLNFPESMISFNTFPGPTLASWLISPTRTSLGP